MKRSALAVLSPLLPRHLVTFLVICPHTSNVGVRASEREGCIRRREWDRLFRERGL